MRFVAPALALCALGACGDVKIPSNPNLPLVAIDSRFVRDAYAKPAELHNLLYARHVALVAGDGAAHERIEHHLERLAMARLLGSEPPQARSVAGVVAAAGATPTKADREKVLAGTLRPRLVHAPDGHGLFPAKDSRMFLAYRYEGRSVWSSHSTSYGTPYMSYLRIEVENASPHVVSQFDVRLHLALPGGKTRFVDCRARPFFERLAPGESAVHVCAEDSRFLDPPTLVGIVQAIEADPARWGFEARRINFADPAVSLTANGLFWLGAAKAEQEATSEMRKASCLDRNSCVAGFAYRLKTDPGFGLGFAGALVGAVLAIALRFFPAAQWRAARIASALSVAAFVIVTSGFALRGGERILEAFFVGLAGAVLLVVFNAALWIVLGLLNAFRGRKAAGTA